MKNSYLEIEAMKRTRENVDAYREAAVSNFMSCQEFNRLVGIIHQIAEAAKFARQYVICSDAIASLDSVIAIAAKEKKHDV